VYAAFDQSFDPNFYIIATTSGQDRCLPWGRSVYDWQDWEITVTDRKATIYLDGKPTFTENYREKPGNIMALITCSMAPGQVIMLF
jgi:hypothetical protein